MIMQRKLIYLALVVLSASLGSCNAPIVRNTLALPGKVVRGTAHATGFGGVAGL